METDSNQKGGNKRRDAQGRKDAGSNTQNKEEDKLAIEGVANQRNTKELDAEINEEYNVQNRFDLEPNNYISTKTKEKEFWSKNITYYFNRQSTLYMGF